MLYVVGDSDAVYTSGYLLAPVVTDHVTKAMRAKRSVQTTKPGSLRVDPLHLNRTGYLQVANTVNRATSSLPDATKRHSKPKKRMDV